MHYDGDQYPQGIPITNWQDYDLESRRPDVIFTHYAYDEVVKSTTIHPDFFSDKLRENCGLLVHIPYLLQ